METVINMKEIYIRDNCDLMILIYMYFYQKIYIYREYYTWFVFYFFQIKLVIKFLADKAIIFFFFFYTELKTIESVNNFTMYHDLTLIRICFFFTLLKLILLLNT